MPFTLPSCLRRLDTRTPRTPKGWDTTSCWCNRVARLTRTTWPRLWRFGRESSHEPGSASSSTVNHAPGITIIHAPLNPMITPPSIPDPDHPSWAIVTTTRSDTRLTSSPLENKIKRFRSASATGTDMRWTMAHGSNGVSQECHVWKLCIPQDQWDANDHMKCLGNHK